MTIWNSAREFSRDESGVVTVWSLGWATAFLLIGGLSIDAGNAWRTKEMLQATADAAALAGTIELDAMTDDDAREEAIRIADLNLGYTVLIDADIVSGAWDVDTRTLDTAAVLKDAVQVTTRRSSATDNALPTFLLKLIGFSSWDVGARATAQRFIPGCIQSGLISRMRVEVSSNNEFLEGICLHGQTGVKISSNNYFEEGVKVTMPDLSSLQIPNSGLETNEGLEQALGEDWIDPKIVDHVSDIVTALKNPASSRQPDYINPSLPAISLTRSGFESATLIAGRVYKVNCTGGSAMNIKTVQNIVLSTNCKLSFNALSKVSNAILATSNTSTQSINGSGNSIVGADDNCAPGGGAQLITAGEVHFASGLKLSGSQIVAVGSVTIAAQNDGIEGASIQSAHDIKLTSLSSFGSCNTNIDQILYEDYFRLVL